MNPYKEFSQYEDHMLNVYHSDRVRVIRHLVSLYGEMEECLFELSGNKTEDEKDFVLYCASRAWDDQSEGDLLPYVSYTK